MNPEGKSIKELWFKEETEAHEFEKDMANL